MGKELLSPLLVVMGKVRAVQVMVGREGEDGRVTWIPSVIHRGVGIQLIMEVRIKGPQGIIESRSS